MDLALSAENPLWTALRTHLCMLQDAAGKVQGAAKTQYETAKDTASNIADKAQGHAKDAHGQAKARTIPCFLRHPAALRFFAAQMMAWTTHRSPLHISTTLIEDCAASDRGEDGCMAISCTMQA